VTQGPGLRKGRQARGTRDCAAGRGTEGCGNPLVLLGLGAVLPINAQLWSRSHRRGRTWIPHRTKTLTMRRNADVSGSAPPRRMPGSIPRSYASAEEAVDAGASDRAWRPVHAIPSVASRMDPSGPWSPPASAAVLGWTDIISVAAGNVHTFTNTGKSHTVGLRSDGTVLAVGWDGDGQWQVLAWRQVAAIAAGGRRTVGLRADGTARAVGRMAERECEVGTWREMVAIAAGDWRGLAAVAAGYLHTVGLTKNGSVVAAGRRTSPECDVAGWIDVMAVSADNYHTVGVRAEARVSASGPTATGKAT
jgi:hypothetical protein